ncbi:uncharacterized protein THITE_2128443 [Thermothielavioides terrestris NRRL 8126]|uniref:Uncharacterized protein n=1 Tax=Thermothielavioides terrestris (strain ATCC 38088 / NRRL 8126) TaxID=578455 RepID=G2QZP0_THETT|nr:uncharacterized protein THITE_2128443 [Thermothielavioides terrestris NRRL 8126]AEO66369.1 hypothetical protein THITE_2128443 [Thermothielavioides terrestris NRRL 8126]
MRHISSPLFSLFMLSSVTRSNNGAGFRNRRSAVHQSLRRALDIIHHGVYSLQGRSTAKKMRKQSTLSSPVSIYIYTLKYFFGVPDKVLAIYRADNPGPFSKPYPGNIIPSVSRIDYIAHHGFLQAFSGPNLRPASLRFIQGFVAGAGD